MSSGTPRARPVARPASLRGERPSSPRPGPSSKPANGEKEKKIKAKKVKGDRLPPTAPLNLEMPMNRVTDLNEEQAKNDLHDLQKMYGALIVNFNNQQAELAKALKENAELQTRIAELEEERSQPLSHDTAIIKLQRQLETANGVLIAY